MYGPGILLKTNPQGFRADHDTASASARRDVRVICSGDSFTLGYGVDNDHAWCQRLAAIDPRLETVNMGQGGYGIDQAYLWFARDGDSLEPRHPRVRADHRRLPSHAAASFLGHGKPVLDLGTGIS